MSGQAIRVMPRLPNSSLPSCFSYLPKKRLQLVRPETSVSAASNFSVKASAPALIASAGIPSISASFQVVPSSAVCAPPQQAVMAANRTAAVKIFFMLYCF